jgi:hypothetical protein
LQDILQVIIMFAGCPAIVLRTGLENNNRSRQE